MHRAKRRDGWNFLVGILGLILVTNGLLRGVLLARFGGPGPRSFLELLELFAAGFSADLFVGLALLSPWLLIWAFRGGRARPWTRAIWNLSLAIFLAVFFFLACAEYFFFEEFRSRFNTVAVDYLLYPHEVFINIWDTYPVAWVAFFAVAAGCAASWSGSRWLAPGESSAMPGWKWRWARALAWMMALAALWPLQGRRMALFPMDRTLREIASNGWYNFVLAAVTRELDFEPFYKSLTPERAFERARELLAEPGARFVSNGRSIVREISGDRSNPKWNVVLLLEESLGSEFFGCLGRAEPSCTPRLDQLSAEGILFTNIYASGNRTVRGMEGVLCGFPPLPGDSVVVRSKGRRIETLARALKRDGYATTFIYAGRGVFDGVRSFMTSNGYDRFIEQKDFVSPDFSTIWGVCNEDLYQRGLEECRRASASGQPFLLTMLSVSNHKPFTYPSGRIEENPAERKRQNAVKYADYAIGKFFEQARRESFWTNTIFVVVADHGARVYGRETIPLGSYEIPFLVLGPAVVKTPMRVGMLGGQVDVAPTILGLIGRPYVSSFFGRDLLKTPAGSGRAFLNHNRDIGLLENDTMVVLGLNKTEELFRGNAKAGEMRRENPGLAPESGEDAISLYQVANELYLADRFNVDEANQPRAPFTRAMKPAAFCRGQSRAKYRVGDPHSLPR